MINRITGLDAPGAGRSRLGSTFFVPERAQAEDRLSGLGKQIEKFIGDHPVAALTLGLSFGIVVGCLIKRR